MRRFGRRIDPIGQVTRWCRHVLRFGCWRGGVIGGRFDGGIRIGLRHGRLVATGGHRRSRRIDSGRCCLVVRFHRRSEEHTSELQSLMRISYAVFCLKKKKQNITKTNKTTKQKHRELHYMTKESKE